MVFGFHSWSLKLWKQLLFLVSKEALHDIHNIDIDRHWNDKFCGISTILLHNRDWVSCNKRKTSKSFNIFDVGKLQLWKKEDKFLLLYWFLFFIMLQTLLNMFRNVFYPLFNSCLTYYWIDCPRKLPNAGKRSSGIFTWG